MSSLYFLLFAYYFLILLNFGADLEEESEARRHELLV